MIQLKNLSLSFGARQILHEVNCIFQTNEHIGVIGRNGAGKSMLLKLIASVIQPNAGEVNIAKGTRIAYLPQEEVLSSELNVYDEAYSAFKDIVQTNEEIRSIEAKLTDGTFTDEDLEKYAQLQSSASQFNEHEAQKQTYEVLNGLGFTQEAIKKNVSQLSTGWKMRLALAKLLLTDADFYLFDEPTNHLDIVTQQWFLEKLQSLKKGFLIVSHDRAYLEKACTNILEIERGRGTYYRGNLKAYIEQKERQIEIARATRARQEKEIEQKQATVERFRSSASRAKQAQSLIKQIERIDLVEVESPLPTINFKLPSPQRSGSVVLSFNNLSQSFGSKIIFNGISAEIERGERVALVAANGVGKTTLLNCISGKQKPISGIVNLGHNVKAAIFEQDQAQTLDLDKTIFQELCVSCNNVPEIEIRKILGSFLFSGDDVHKKIGVLSGGEKNRVAMTKLLLQKANFLILDEPTNHLDLYSKDILCQALKSYEGTILFVSHDYDFVDKLSTRILELTPDKANSYLGTYEEFYTSKKAELAQKNQINYIDLDKQKNTTHETASANNTKETKKRILELERKISKLERDQAKENEKMSKFSYDSAEYINSAKRLKANQEELQIAQKEWEELVDAI